MKERQTGWQRVGYRNRWWFVDPSGRIVAEIIQLSDGSYYRDGERFASLEDAQK